MDEKDDDGFAGKYWICHECAKVKYPNRSVGVVTGIIDKCSWCRREHVEMLIPCIDYEGLGD